MLIFTFIYVIFFSWVLSKQANQIPLPVFSLLTIWYWILAIVLGIISAKLVSQSPRTTIRQLMHTFHNPPDANQMHQSTTTYKIIYRKIQLQSINVCLKFIQGLDYLFPNLLHKYSVGWLENYYYAHIKYSVEVPFFPTGEFLSIQDLDITVETISFRVNKKHQYLRQHQVKQLINHRVKDTISDKFIISDHGNDYVVCIDMI